MSNLFSFFIEGFPKWVELSYLFSYVLTSVWKLVRCKQDRLWDVSKDYKTMICVRMDVFTIELIQLSDIGVLKVR